jgi:hypothetical protein
MVGDSANIEAVQAPDVDPGPGGALGEWRPTTSTLGWWAVLGGLLGGAGGLFYLWVASAGRMPTEWSLNIVLAAFLVLALVAVHEAVHAVVMRAYGASPRFGVLREGRMIWGFYTTAPGFRFSRREYLTVGLAPLAIVAPLGIALCLTPIGWALWFPFAVHLGGCIGDLTIARQVLSGPVDVVCEDLADGFRTWPATQEQRS